MQGTTFRYVSNKVASSMKVRIFNTAGVPIDIVSGDNTNEAKWQNPSLKHGIYVYVMEITARNGRKESYKGMMEVQK